MSISSEDSFASCTSFPYSDDFLKSDGSRSITPSIQSDRLSRDDLDQYYSQVESSRSTNSLLDVASDVQLSDTTNQENVIVSHSSFKKIFFFPRIFEILVFYLYNNVKIIYKMQYSRPAMAEMSEGPKRSSETSTETPRWSETYLAQTN